jgi:hypothetical protein
MPQAATIKQAKAAYKSRTEQPLTEREQKQLERGLQLDRRAWALREREKNKLDSAKKRVAEEKAKKDEERRLGTQRRNDKFGFKSSQFHLGAFFRKPAPGEQAGADVKDVAAVAVSEGGREPGEECEAMDSAVESMDLGEEDADEFEDEYEGLDDETLLEALQSPEVARFSKALEVDKTEPITSMPTTSMPPPPRPDAARSTTTVTHPQSQLIDQDLEWQDFLESSTQIAREIEAEAPSSPCVETRTPTVQETLRKGSFSSGSFDLTEDDFDQLDPTPHIAVGKGQHTKRQQEKAAEERLKMPPPPLPFPRGQPDSRDKSKCHNATAASVCNSTVVTEDLGFTMTQLESFVEDDLELSQSV